MKIIGYRQAESDRESKNDKFGRFSVFQSLLLHFTPLHRLASFRFKLRLKGCSAIAGDLQGSLQLVFGEDLYETETKRL